MRLLIVSDAWFPQINGVVRTLDTTRRLLGEAGHTVEVIGPDHFRTVPTPGYREIPLALLPKRKLKRLSAAFRPDAVHIATEGPLGWAMRSICRRRGWPFTTSFHTQFPEYIWLRTRLPLSWSYALMRFFHGRAVRTMVATPTLERRLAERGFSNLVRWGRGVDIAQFRPYGDRLIDGPAPVMVYVGRVAVEKNLTAFLDLDIAGTKVVIGGGPQLDGFVRRYPQVRFLGPRTGEDLGRHLASGDVFVFPSRTDTFGLVMLEAMACGLPVAAYPVQGPVDVVEPGVTGCLDEDLGRAIAGALATGGGACRDHAVTRSWPAAVNQFLGNLAPFGQDDRVPLPLPAVARGAHQAAAGS
ncbi:MAG: glycosyltransferase family 1 protein [Azospirillaceae bacterium]